jgi:Na+/proline symporter
MHPIDWAIVALYVLSAIGIGVYFTKRAANSTADFFVAGRTLPWWIAGTSIVATTFSADTPLFVAGLSRTTGIHGNWFWWSAAIGSIASVFFFAKLWRRTEALTDIEFVVKALVSPSVKNRMRHSLEEDGGYEDVCVYNDLQRLPRTLAMAFETSAAFMPATLA